MLYDHASLVTLPVDMRIKYVTLQATNTQILLITLDYPQHEMQGPPFSVQGEAVERLFRFWCDIELLASEDVLEQLPRGDSHPLEFATLPSRDSD